MLILKNKILGYLDKLTAITGVDLRYVAKGSSWSVIDLVIGNIASLLLAMAFSRFLPKEAYGAYGFVLSWVGIFSTFAMSGINVAIIRSIAKGFEGDLQAAVKSKLRWGLISSVLSVAFAIYYFVIGNNSLAISFALAAIFLPPYLASSMFASFFSAKELFKYNTLASLIVRFASLATMTTTIFLTDLVPIIILAYFVPDTIIKLSFFWMAVKRFQKNKHVSKDTNIFAMHLTAMNIIGGISKRLDQILLFHAIGAVEVAVYRFALVPFERIQILVTVLTGIVSPRFAKRSYTEIYQVLGRKLIWFSLLIAAIGLSAFLVMPLVFKILFPQYMESVYYGRILLLPLAFAAPSIIQSIWTAKAEIKKLYILKVITHVSRIAFFAIFIPMYGMAGAIWSQIGIAFFAGFYIFSMYLREKSKFLANGHNQDN